MSIFSIMYKEGKVVVEKNGNVIELSIQDLREMSVAAMVRTAMMDAGFTGVFRVTVDELPDAQKEAK